MVTPVIHADVTQHAVEGYGGDDTAIPTTSTTVGQNIASIHPVYRQRSIWKIVIVSLHRPNLIIYETQCRPCSSVLGGKS